MWLQICRRILELREHLMKRKRKGKRRTNSSGTNKIDKNCTATLKVVTREDQSYGKSCNANSIYRSKNNQGSVAAWLAELGGTGTQPNYV